MQDLDNDLVRDREQWYASRPDYMQRMTERSSRYLFHIVEEIERRRIPMELALLPFIESAFNPQAVSSARAAGMWQFMPATGQSFDLKQNVFRDDRRDVLASTTAALDYLEQLHGRFGDWHLALAAYNWGQGNVNRAITRNQRAGLPTGYTDIDMPLETRMYVPKLQAVKNILARPESFGAQLPDIGNHPFFDTLTLTNDIDVSLIACLSGVSEADFRVLNPSIKQPIVMAAGTPQILLPWDNAGVFEQRLAAHKGPLASWTAWVVPTTMSVEQAAQRAAMSEDELRRVNNIPPRMLVRGGFQPAGPPQRSPRQRRERVCGRPRPAQPATRSHPQAHHRAGPQGRQPGASGCALRGQRLQRGELEQAVIQCPPQDRSAPHTDVAPQRQQQVGGPFFIEQKIESRGQPQEEQRPAKRRPRARAGRWPPRATAPARPKKPAAAAARWRARTDAQARKRALAFSANRLV